MDNIRQEKCHVYLDLGGASPASLNFKSTSKQEAEDIFNKIQKSRTLCPATSLTLTHPVGRSISVPTCQTAQGLPNASAARTPHHEPGKDGLAAPSPTSVPVPSHARLASRTVRVVNSRCRVQDTLIMIPFMLSLTFLSYVDPTRTQECEKADNSYWQVWRQGTWVSMTEWPVCTRRTASKKNLFNVERSRVESSKSHFFKPEMLTMGANPFWMQERVSPQHTQ